MAVIDKHGSGYRARISIKSPTGTYQRKSKSGFKTKKEAKAWAAEQETLKNKGSLSLDSNILFSEYFKQWYTLYKTNITPSSLRWYKYAYTLIQKHMAPVTLDGLTRPIVQAFFNELGEHYAYDTSRKMRMYVRGAIKSALFDGVIHRDPTQGITLTGRASKSEELKYLEEHQLVALVSFIEAIPNLKRSASDQMILIGAMTGVRFQEAVVLTPADFSHQVLEINKAFDQYTQITKSTKTESSERAIAIPEELTANILDWASDKHIKANDLLFSYSDDKPLSSVAVNKRLRHILEKTNSPKIITYHGLRHTHASILIHHDTNIQYISKRLGHASTSITLDTYTHLLKETQIKEDNKTIQLMSQLKDQIGPNLDQMPHDNT